MACIVLCLSVSGWVYGRMYDWTTVENDLGRKLCVVALCFGIGIDMGGYM